MQSANRRTLDVSNAWYLGTAIIIDHVLEHRVDICSSPLSICMRYRLLEHTADAMVEVHGETLEERFANAAYALFDQMTDVSKIQPTGEMRIQLEADTREQLIVDFLQELLFLHDAENLVFNRFDIVLDGTRLDARIHGEEFDEDRHPKRSVVKGVTYHRLEFNDAQKILIILFDV